MCSTAVIYTSGHAKAVKQPDEGAAIWCAKSTKDADPEANIFTFWFLKLLHFPFHSNSPLQSCSSSPIITPSSFLSLFFFLFFYSSLHPRSAWILRFLQLHHFHSNCLVQSSTLLLLLRLLSFLSAYLWSRCSFPSHSPTQRSPGFSSPAGPGVHHMKTPVQVVHTRAYLYQWFINTRVERSWIRN